MRGSTPCHGEDTAGIGGNTSCVSLDVPGEDPLLFDLGTGLRYFGASQPHDGSFRGTCLLTHLHWDHIQGLPFFTPLLREGAQLDIYAPTQDDGRTLAEVMDASICPPLFPVCLSQFPGTFRFHDVADSEFAVGGMRVMSRVVPHVGTTLGFRVEAQGRSVVYISDHQMPHDGSHRMADGVLDLIQDADVLIHDAQYTPDEFMLKRHWGHCTPEFAVWLATEAKVRTLVLFHHDPGRNDRAVEQIGRRAAAAAAASGVDVVVAREGLVLDVG